MLVDVLMGIGAGLCGTAMMDLGNGAVAATGAIGKVDAALIGRMAAGWARGRFRYASPAEVSEIPLARLKGYLVHYAIGASFGVLLGLWRARPSPGITVVYGLGTSVVALFVLMPLLGLGAFGRKTPRPSKVVATTLVNHLFYGLGLVACFALRS